VDDAGNLRPQDLVLFLQEPNVLRHLPVSAEANSASSGWKIAAISVLPESGIWNGFAHWLYSTLCCVVLQRYAKPALQRKVKQSRALRPLGRKSALHLRNPKGTWG
jgi:hypothetical protein